MTESILKTKNFFFPFINQENSNTIELDSKDNNKDNNIDYLNNKMNTIFNNYNSFYNKRKKINMKLMNNKNL